MSYTPPRVSSLNRPLPRLPSQMISESLEGMKMELEGILADPLSRKPEQLNNDFQLLMRFLDRTPIPDLDLLLKFIYVLGRKISFENQIELYLKAAEFYRKVESFEHLWFLIRAYRISSERGFDKFTCEIQKKIDDCEDYLITTLQIKYKHNKQRDETIRPYIEKLEIALQKDLENFNKTILELVEVAKNWIKEKRVEDARQLLTSLITRINKPQTYAHVTWDICISGKKQFELLLKSLPTTPFKCFWEDFRKEFQIIKISSHTCQEYSKKKKELLQKILKHCISLITHLQPCEFEILLLGSLTRGEGTPFSDFELAVLLSDIKMREQFIKHYLPTLLILVQFYLNGLDDQWIIEFKDHLGRLTSTGCHLDPSFLPFLIGNSELHMDFLKKGQVFDDKKACICNHPEELVKWYAKISVNPEADEGLLKLAYSMCFAQPLVQSASNVNLFSHFKGYLKSWLDIPLNRQLCHQNLRGFHEPIFRHHSYDFIENRVKIKAEWIQPLVFWCFDLALHLGYDNLFTVQEILNKLKDDKKLPDYFLNAIASTYDKLNSLRLDKQRKRTLVPDNGDPNEFYVKEINWSAITPINHQDLPILTKEELSFLKKSKEYILDICFAIMQQLHKNPDKKELSDPLLALCQSRVKKQLPIHISPVVALKEILNKIKEIKTSSFELEMNLELTQETKIRLQENYLSLQTKEGRIAWLHSLLHIDALFHLTSLKSITELLDEIFFLPSHEGWRIAQDLEILNFCQEIKDFVIKKDRPASNEPFLTTYDLDNPFNGKSCEYFLKPHFSDQLLTKDNKFIPSSQEVPALHTVLPVAVSGQKVFWTKVCPENAAMESLAWHLAWCLGEGSVPPSLITKLTVNSESIAVLLIQHVQGIRMSHPKAPIDHITLASFTESLLKVLVMSPGDDKPEDYYLIPLDEGNTAFKLMRIDNERIMCKSVDKYSLYKIYTSSKATIRSVLFFHDLMKMPLDEQTLKNFLKVSPQKLAKTSLDYLEHLQQMYRSIFSEQDVIQHLNAKTHAEKWAAKATESSILAVFLSTPWFNRLFGNLQSLYWFCQKRKITGNELLLSMHPNLHKLLLPAWENYALKGQLHRCLERLDSMLLFAQDKALNRSSQLPQQLLMSDTHGITLDQKELVDCYQNKANHPKGQYPTLEKMEKDAIHFTLDKLDRNDPGYIDDFCNLYSINQNQVLEKLKDLSLTIEKQRLVVKGLINAKSKLNHLNLKPYRDIIDDGLLETILKKHGKRLLSIDLSDCQSFTDRGISLLNYYCPNLKIIAINRNSKLTHFWTKNLKLLSKVYLKDCSSLKKVEIDSFQLKKLVVCGSENLFYLQNASPYVDYLDIEGCKSLKMEEVVDKIQVFNLKSLKCSFGYDKDPLLRQYPFFLSCIQKLPLHLITEIVTALNLSHVIVEKLSHFQIFELQNFLVYLGNTLQMKDTFFKDKSMCRWWVTALRLMGVDEAQKFFTLFKSFLKDKNPDVRKGALEALQEMEFENKELVSTFLNSHLKDEKTSQAAAFLLAKMGLKSPEIFQALVESGKENSENLTARMSTTLALTICINTQPFAIKGLLLSLKDPVLEIRLAAANGLGSLKNTSKEIFQALFEATKDENHSVRLAVYRTLGKIADHITLTILFKELTIAMQDPHYVLEALNNVSLDLSDKKLEVVVEKSADANHKVQIAAIECLGRCKNANSLILDKLFLALKSDHLEVCIGAIKALKRFISKDVKLIEKLIGHVNKFLTQPDVITALLELLGEGGSKLDLQIYFIHKYFDHDMPKVSQAALKAMRLVGRDAFTFYIDILLLLLQSNQNNKVLTAIEALGICGRNDDRVIPALLAAAGNDSVKCIFVLRAFAELETQDKTAIAWMCGHLKANAWEVRKNAIKSLEFVGKQELLVSDALYQCLKIEVDPSMICHILDVLTSRGDRNSFYLDLVLNFFSHQEQEVRSAAVRLMGVLGKHILEIEKFFNSLYRKSNWNPQVFTCILQAYGAIGSSKSEIVNEVLAHVSKKNENAIVALGNIPMADQKVMDALINLVMEGNQTAEKSLKKLAQTLPMLEIFKMNLKTTYILFSLRFPVNSINNTIASIMR